MAHAHDHDFFVPQNNIWFPFSCASIGMLAFSFIFWQHFSLIGAQILVTLGGGGLLFSLMQMLRQFFVEGRVRGFAKKDVPLVQNLQHRYGVIFFIVSEVMFFAAFFAAYFYLRLYNGEWPPANIETLAINLPLINTLLLLTSGTTVTFAHHALLHGDRQRATFYTFLTWQLGVIFLLCQAFEYSHASFGLGDGVYATVFYLLTGFHGMHVAVGSLMLMMCHYRLTKGDFSKDNHFFFEATAWYWHFVDVVWVGLLLFVYIL